MMKVVLFVSLCMFACTYAYPNSNSALETLATFNNSQFKHNLLNPPNPSYWINTPGGNVSYMNLTTNRVLAGGGVSLSLNVLEPCGVILPHSHPRAGKITYSITSEKLFVGFIQENGARTVFNNLTVGEGAFVPRGAIMFFQNLDCKPGMNLFAYNYEDPGLLSLAPNMARFPDAVLQAGFRMDQNELDVLKQHIPGYPIGLYNECRVRCGLPTTPPVPTPTQAPPAPTPTPQPENICVNAGTMKCTGSNTYQTCDHGFWQATQTCQPGLICMTNGSYIYCQ